MLSEDNVFTRMMCSSTAQRRNKCTTPTKPSTTSIPPASPIRRHNAADETAEDGFTPAPASKKARLDSRSPNTEGSESPSVICIGPFSTEKHTAGYPNPERVPNMSWGSGAALDGAAPLFLVKPSTQPEDEREIQAKTDAVLSASLPPTGKPMPDTTGPQKMATDLEVIISSQHEAEKATEERPLPELTDAMGSRAQATTTPLPPGRRRLAKKRCSSESDDEAEAFLLMNRKGSGHSHARNPPPAGRALPRVPDLSLLPWQDRRADIFREVMQSFERQLFYEMRQDLPIPDSASSPLSSCGVGIGDVGCPKAFPAAGSPRPETASGHNPTLMQTLAPFFKDRVLDEILEDDSLLTCPQLPPAPIISATDTGASPGLLLRPYQVEGVQFLLNNFHKGLSCILADDMGLGKTAQIASFLHILKRVHQIPGPHLIVAPLTTLTGWVRELHQWAPTLCVIKYHGEQQARYDMKTNRSNRHGVFVTTPSTLLNDRSFFKKHLWVTVIVDEAHLLKGTSTSITVQCRKLQTCFRVAVTGTPVHNRMSEVWNLMSFLFPKCSTSFDGSIGQSGDAVVDVADETANSGSRDPTTCVASRHCAQLLKAVMLRRTKHTMDLGIPPRTDAPTCMLEPTRVQATLLQNIAAKALQDGRSASLFTSLSHQRAVCNHPMAVHLLAAAALNESEPSVTKRLATANVSLSEKDLLWPSAKMLHLDVMLAGLRQEGHRVLIFSNFTSTLDLLEGFCILRQYSYERLDGSYNRVERELSMMRFNAPNASTFLFLITTTAGGVGVTLTGADTVILFDAHYNPQIDRQAADRAHRIGQTRPVHVHRLCVRDTIEEHIRGIAERKASLGDLIVDGAQQEVSERKLFSAEELRHMFEQVRRQQEMHSDAERQLHKDDASDQAAQETLLIRRTMEVMADGKRGQVKTSRQGMSACPHTHLCFPCGERMRPLEPLWHCLTCTKAYHPDCARRWGGKEIRKRENGGCTSAAARWVCPRHACMACGKSQSVDGAIFACYECPFSCCFDCLDRRYFEMDPQDGAKMLNIRKTYPAMEEEGMSERRSLYYLRCLRCLGVEGSSSSSENDEEEETEESSEEEGFTSVEEVEM